MAQPPGLFSSGELPPFQFHCRYPKAAAPDWLKRTTRQNTYNAPPVKLIQAIVVTLRSLPPQTALCHIPRGGVHWTLNTGVSSGVRNP